MVNNEFCVPSEGFPTTAGHHRQPDGEGSAKAGPTLDPSGYDAGKKAVGRERHLLTETVGMLLAVIVPPTNVYDRGGAEAPPGKARKLLTFVEQIIGGVRRSHRPARIATISVRLPRLAAHRKARAQTPGRALGSSQMLC